MAITRRVALTSGVVASSTMVLAACAAEPTVVATTDPSGTVDATAAPAAGVVMLGEASEVLVGTGKKFEIDAMLTILVTQPREGIFKAFSATCTHAGCIVNGVQDQADSLRLPRGQIRPGVGHGSLGSSKNCSWQDPH